MTATSDTAAKIVRLPFPGFGGGKKSARSYELEFLPAAVEILESPASPLGRAVALAISLFVAIAILWASVGEIDIVAVAPGRSGGRIVPTGRTKTVQAQGRLMPLNPGESGVIREIAVEEGQHVAAGQLLVALDATETKADNRNLAQQRMHARLQIARLRSILNLAGGDVLDHPPAEADESMVLLERSLKAAQVAQYQELIGGIEGEIEKQKAASRATGNEVAKLNETIPLMIDRLTAKQGLLQKGPPWTHRAPRMQVLELQQTLIEMQRDRDAAGNHVAEGKAAISELKRQKAQAPEGLRHGAQFVQDRTKELADAEAQAAALDQELAKSAERQRLKAILAPVAGTVQRLGIHTVGGMIEPGQTLMAIVPDDFGIIDTAPGLDPGVEAMIQNQDIGFVHEGEEAVIKLEAFPFTRYGTVPGKIKIVSEDAVGGSSSGGAANPLSLQGEGRGEGASALGASPSAANALYYTARVTLDRNTMNIDGAPSEARGAKEGKDVKLTPGMAATVEIKTGKRKLIEFLLSPLMKMKDEAGRER